MIGRLYGHLGNWITDSGTSGVLFCQFFDPFVASEAEEYWQALEDLVGLDDADDGGGRPFPDKCREESERHDNAPCADQIEDKAESGIAGASDDAGTDGHLVGHSDHDKAQNVHKLVCKFKRLVVESVHAKERASRRKKNDGQVLLIASARRQPRSDRRP